MSKNKKYKKMAEQVIIYKIGGDNRPSNNLKQKIWLKIYSLPFFNKMNFVKNKLCKAFGIPSSTSISKGFYCSAPNIQVGENTGLGNLYIRAIGKVTIGNNCSFSYNNMILTGTHDYSDFSTVIAKPVTIGNNVWITSNVTILPGVTIGDNTIIGAGSVVTKDIPSGVFAAGNPCRVIKKIDFKK